jgi:GNAT superfamily N-acetyltransferase
MPELAAAKFHIRLATPDDAGTIGWHRARMFQDMGMVPDELFESFRTKSLDQLHEALASGEYVGWLAADPDGSRKIIAGAGVVLRQVPPFPLRHENGEVIIAEGYQALIVNVFTEPEWRRCGLGRLLMQQIIAWARKNRIESLVLHASDDGRALYEQLGFIAATEMRFSGDLHA